MQVTKTFTILLAIFLMLGLSSLTAAAGKNTSVLKGELNINTATVKQLAMLSGIGKKTAESIVQYRTQSGNYKTVDDLGKVKGIGKKILEKNRAYIILEGESTLKKGKK